MTPLSSDFFENPNVVSLAKNLIGKVLVTNFDDQKTSGIIIETEAYEGTFDKASHAYNGKRTPRNEAMYAKAGTVYVYICYGIHHLFNIVTHSKGIPHAILIRALQPLDGIKVMQERRNQYGSQRKISNGPGTLSQAMGINKDHNFLKLGKNQNIWIEDRKVKMDDKKIKITPRIGINYAEDHALLPYRFVYSENIST